MVPVHIEVIVSLGDSPKSKQKAAQFFERVIDFPCLPPRDMPIRNRPLHVDFDFEEFYFDLEHGRFEAFIRDECEDEIEFEHSLQGWLRCGFTAIVSD